MGQAEQLRPNLSIDIFNVINGITSYQYGIETQGAVVN